MLATHIDAEKRYQSLRETALAASEGILKKEYAELKLTIINQAALSSSQQW